MSGTPAAVGLVALVVMHVAVLAGCSWIIGHLRRGVAQRRRRVVFARDGRRYELDLPEKNARMLRDAVALFVAAARCGGGGRRRPGRSAPKAQQRLVAGQDSPAIGEWAPPARPHGVRARPHPPLAAGAHAEDAG